MDRARTAMHVLRTVGRLRETALDVELSAERASAVGLHRPAFYRERAHEAAEGMRAVRAGLDAALELLDRYARLYPAAHDDDLDAAGRCTCGRPADSCPARAAAAAGSLTWADETGNTRPLDDAASDAIPPAEPEAAP